MDTIWTLTKRIELSFYWIFTFLTWNELLLNWTKIFLNFHWTKFLLNFCDTEPSCYLTELDLYWSEFWMNWTFTVQNWTFIELSLNWTFAVIFRNFYCTELNLLKFLWQSYNLWNPQTCLKNNRRNGLLIHVYMCTKRRFIKRDRVKNPEMTKKLEHS